MSPPSDDASAVRGPRAVLVPFGVPPDDRGLGLGLAALLHGCLRYGGHSIALAQLQSLPRDSKAPSSHASGASVEGMVTPAIWREIARNSGAPEAVELVITGSFEPPHEGHGTLRMRGFDALDGTPRFRVDVNVEDERLGRDLVSAVSEALSAVGGELGPLGAIASLPWSVLESLLLAERCLLVDPLTHGPHDPLSALTYLGRALSEAPDAEVLGSRLASVSLELATSDPSGRFVPATRRALTRALEDAGDHPAMLEALAVLEMRAGDTVAAARIAERAVGTGRASQGAYLILSELRSSAGDSDGALLSLDQGLARFPKDVVMESERGAVLFARDEVDHAVSVWRAVLEREPSALPAFIRLAGVADKNRDAEIAALLVDKTLSVAEHASPMQLRRSLEIMLALEGPGLSRGVRVARLARVLVDKTPDDPTAVLLWARGLVESGDVARAAEKLRALEMSARTTLAGAEAARVVFALEHADDAGRVEALLRSIDGANAAELDAISLEARRLARLHDAWTAHLAVGRVERRLGRLALAREALTSAIESAPGASSAYAELAETLLSLGEATLATTAVEKCLTLEGASRPSMELYRRALTDSGRHAEAAECARQLSDAPPPASAPLDEPVSPSGDSPRSQKLLDRILGGVGELLRRSSRR